MTPQSAPPSPAPPPLYPDTGSGAGQNFSVSVTDPVSAANITFMDLIFNWQPSAIGGCQINYDVMNDALSVSDLTGSMSTFTPISLHSSSGQVGDNVNSNCLVYGSGSTIATVGTTVTLHLNVQFRGPNGASPGFIGPQNVYTAITDSTQTGNYQLVGGWTAFPVPYPNHYSNSTAPSSFNSDGTVSIGFFDDNGYDYQPYAEASFGGASFADPNACRIRYDRAPGASHHVLSVYAGDFTSIAEIGTAPVGSPGAHVVGGQGQARCLLDMARSYIVAESGTGTIVNLALSFYGTGTFNSFVQGFDRQQATGTMGQGSLFLPPASLSLSSPVNSVSLQQAASAPAFVLSVAAGGGYSGPVNLSYTAPAGVTVTLGSSALNPPSVSQTTVTIAASASLTGSGTVVFTASVGGVSTGYSVPFTVITPPVIHTVTGTSGFTLASTTASLAVAPSTSNTQFIVTVPTTGNFSGNVNFTYSAPTGVSLQFSPATLAVPSGGQTTVTVVTAANAVSGPITVTGQSGSISSTLGGSLTVLTTPTGNGDTSPSPPSFSLSGPQDLTAPPGSGSATFTVSLTGSNSFNQPIAVSVDGGSTSNFVSVVLNYTGPGTGTEALTAYAGSSFTATLTYLPTSSTNFVCAEIQGVSGSITSYTPLCLTVNSPVNPQNSISFALPQTSVTVPSGGSVTVQGNLGSNGTATASGFQASVTCPTNVFPCDATVTAVNVGNGIVNVTVNPGSLPVGTDFIANVRPNELPEPTPCPIHVGPPGGGGGGQNFVAPSITPNNSYFVGTTLVSMSTNNDGSTGSGNYALSCGTGTCNTSLLGACTATNAGSHITLNTAVTSAVFTARNNFYFAITAVADDQAIAGTYAITCPYAGSLLSAESLAVYDATPVITSVSPSWVSQGNETITITGHNFGTNPIVTIDGTAYPPISVQIGDPQVLTVNFNVYEAPGSILPVTVTSQGEETGVSEFFASPAGTPASQRISVTWPLPVKNPITIYLLHGIGQTSLDMARFYQTLTSISPPSGLDLSRYRVDAGFSFGECSQSVFCSASQYGDTCGIDAGSRSLARYILGNPPPGDIVLIGYSMGGLIARNLIANNYLATGLPATGNAQSITGTVQSKIVGLITLGTPNLGYPYDPIDAVLNCGLLERDMAGSWLPLTTPPVELSSQAPSTFLQGLYQQWQSFAYTGYWLAAAGTKCVANATRTTPPLGVFAKGCISPPGTLTPGYNDGVVCRDSAVYQPYPALFPGFVSAPTPAPTLTSAGTTWEDPEHIYVHANTAGAFGSTFLLCGNTPGINPQLFDPPNGINGLLLIQIVRTLNGH